MQVTLVLETGPDRPGGPNRFQRLRKLLKALLRCYGFRCVRIEAKTPSEEN